MITMTDLMPAVTPTVRLRPQYDGARGHAVVSDVVLADARGGVQGTGVSTGIATGNLALTFEAPATHLPVTRKLVGVVAGARFRIRSSGSTYGPPV